ncbi:MAG: metallophosphatase [Herminiimonas sp.]|nr:metallophosphatase [Herminiimonas sp.]
MRTIVQLSDLHFGRIDEALIGPLTDQVRNFHPDLVVVSGDLTQRARTREFKQARQFLDTLPTPQIVVPGNHDVPLHNLFSRFVTPLAKYQRYITDDLEPVYVDDEIAVLGINTARSLTIKDGRISDRQIQHAKTLLCSTRDDVVKIIVTHHPFDLPSHYDERDLVGRAPLAMEMFAACRADLLLAGHMHASHAGDSAARYKIGEYSAIVVQAGTATSTRGRGEANSFNLIRAERAQITIERFSWNTERVLFELSSTEIFKRVAKDWRRVAAP